MAAQSLLSRLSRCLPVASTRVSRNGTVQVLLRAQAKVSKLLAKLTFGSEILQNRFSYSKLSAVEMRKVGFQKLTTRCKSWRLCLKVVRIGPMKRPAVMCQSLATSFVLLLHVSTGYS
ncbi:UNVERIFIED_CONTAM: hypothetical protein K2H54_065144 [Gekko kuhli]